MYFLDSVICCSLIASEVEQVEEDQSPVCGDRHLSSNGKD